MSELKTLYNIIPVNDKCSFLCEGYDGKHFAISKGSITSPVNGKKLIFTTYEAAQDYVNDCLDPAVFFVEEFGGNDEIYNMAYNTRKKLEELHIGDKFWFTGIPYVVIDFDFKSYSHEYDTSKLVAVMSLATFKIVGMTGDAYVGQELGEIII